MRASHIPRLRPGLSIHLGEYLGAGTTVQTEDDVLHVRHLPDFGGHLTAADSEVLLQARAEMHAERYMPRDARRAHPTAGTPTSVPARAAPPSLLLRAIAHARPRVARTPPHARRRSVRARSVGGARIEGGADARGRSSDGPRAHDDAGGAAVLGTRSRAEGTPERRTPPGTGSHPAFLMV